MNLEEARSLFQNWKRDEWGWLRITIVRIAAKRDEFHGDYIAEEDLSERNMIGAAVQALCRQGILYSTGEHRRGKSKVSHGRRSYVYKLTNRGWSLAKGLPPDDRPENDEYEQEGLF